MVKRFLSSTTSEILSYSRTELLESIRLSEGRVIMAEMIAENSIYRDVSNPEMAAALGADLLLLNMYDVNNPYVAQISETAAHEELEMINRVKKLAGRPAGINLEPVAAAAESRLPQGRQAGPENAEKALKQGADFILLTGNPGSDVGSDNIIKSIDEIKRRTGDDLIIIAGKMHMAGISEDYTDRQIIADMIEAGADIILLPAPGTIPGIDIKIIQELVEFIHKSGRLALNAIGTSQESSDSKVIQNLALNSKQTGADIHHIGDAGYGGMAVPENIGEYSRAIRGRRHTYRRMGLSIRR